MNQITTKNKQIFKENNVRFKCCFCGETINGWGNIPSPLEIPSNENKCCDKCYKAFVLPVRREIDSLMRFVEDRLPKYRIEVTLKKKIGEHNG